MTSPSKDGFRAKVLPWVLGAVVAGCGAYFAMRSYRGLPTAANPGKGDFEHFYYAARAMMLGEDVYASHTRGYIYPPLLAMLLRPLAGIGALRTAQLAWAGLNLAMTAATVVIALRVAVRRLGVPWEKLTLLGVSAVGLVLAFEPVRQEMEEGQTDTVVGLCLALALLFLDRKPLLAGAMIGLGANVKYQALVVLPYLLLRRRWAAAASTAASTAGFALVPAIVVGWRRNLEYLATASGGLAKLLGAAPSGPVVATHDIRWEKSISITSGLAKTLGPGVSDAAVLAIAGGVAAVTAGVAWWMYARRGVPLLAGRGGAAEDQAVHRGAAVVEWSGLLTAVLVFSPQTLIRHLYLLLPVMVWAAAMLLVPRKGVGRGVLLVGVLVMVGGMLLPPGNVKSFEPALSAWRSVGGTGWCVLAMFLAMVWTGLEYARAAAEGRPLTDPPPGYGADGRPAARGEYA